MSTNHENCIPSGLRVGFIGAGQMAQALCSGFLKAGMVELGCICASKSNPAVKNRMHDMGVKIMASSAEVVRNSDLVVVAVKPHILPIALQEVATAADDKLFVSIAAGVTIKSIEQMLPSSARVIRVMPNTPALVNCGASVYSPGSNSTALDGHIVAELFSSIGICVTLPEVHLDAVTGLSGSGPAYGFMAIEALADGGVKMGLPRNIALKLAAQTLMGAAKMVLDTGKHPGELKDNVCSPGGTTITAVHELESSGFRASLMNAVQAATNRAKQLGGSS